MFIRVGERTRPEHGIIYRRQVEMGASGQILVAVSDVVTSQQVLGRVKQVSLPVAVDAAGQLGVEPQFLLDYFLKKPGDVVEKGQVLAERKRRIGPAAHCASPVAGRILFVSSLYGQIFIDPSWDFIEVAAGIASRVAQVTEEAVVLETAADLVPGTIGLGGEASGPLMMVVSDHLEELSPGAIDHDAAGKILVGGCRVSAEALTRAKAMGAAGIIIGGVWEKDLRDYLGAKLTPLAMPEERLMPMVVTEGFGRIGLTPEAFDLLKAREGMEAFITGLRGELVIPISGAVVPREMTSEGELKAGSRVRLNRHPYFGAIAQVRAVISEPMRIETEGCFRVVDVELLTGEVVRVPRENLELDD